MTLSVAPGGAANPWQPSNDNNLRQSFDFSTRTFMSGDDGWHVGAFGLDRWQVFSNSSGDLGTLTLQPYLLRIDGAPNAAGIFDGDHDWALQWRIANFNYTGLGHGKFNIRIGHFELPFGLEQVEQTNGTLYQLNSSSLGLKADWGTSINGTLEHWEYEVAYMLGEGNELSSVDGGLFVARVGTSRNKRISLGLSFLEGEQQEPVLTDRSRVGADVSVQIGFGFTGAVEYAKGRDAGERIDHGLAQITWVDRREHLHLYSQLRRSTRTSNEVQQSYRVGLRYEPNNSWSFSTEWQSTSDAFSGATPADLYLAQFRYRL